MGRQIYIFKKSVTNVMFLSLRSLQFSNFQNFVIKIDNEINIQNVTDFSPTFIQVLDSISKPS